jgi:hypothetical protein
MNKLHILDSYQRFIRLENGDSPMPDLLENPVRKNQLFYADSLVDPESGYVMITNRIFEKNRNARFIYSS